MKILLLGKNGQLGYELQHALGSLGTLLACDRTEADFTRSQDLQDLIREYRPTIVVNAAAYTQVEKAEKEQDLAFQINAHAVEVLATEVKKLHACLVHYSTDYVFDGQKTGPYLETDPTGPLNVYGQSKRAGELAIRSSGCRNITLRTSWVFGRQGGHFADTILRLAREKETLQVVSDQIGAPTSAELLANVTALILYRMKSDPSVAEEASGLYHLTPKGSTSFHAYAQFLLSLAALKGIPLKATAERVLPVGSKDYASTAQRPLNSQLDSSTLEAVFDFELPPWQWHVRRYLDQVAFWQKRG